MDVTLTSEQEEICATARRFLAQRCPIAHVRAMAGHALGYDPSLWRQMSELGWLGLSVPDAHDGLGQSFVDLCLLIEQMGRHIVPSPFVSTVAVGAQAIARFGSADQQSRHLPAVAAGDRIIAIARTEPGGSWDPSAVGVTATRDSGGYALEGVATLVDYAGVADVLVTIAELGGSLSAFLVPAGADGISTERLATLEGVASYRVLLDGARLSEDAVLGRPGQGEEIARAIAAWGTVARCAELVGIGQRVLDMTVEYATERVAFGQPIGSFQAVQHHCADMAVDVLSSGSITREAAWRVATGDPRAAETASIAKAWASDAIARVCALGHQVHGAIGFTAEHDLHLYSRRARAAELDFGDAAWHRAQLAAGFGL